MYEQVFNLTSRPFTSMHYVKHYFPAKEIDQTLQMCKLIVDRGTGPVVVIGDHGTGKTLLLAMLEGAFKSKYRLVNISATVIRNREDLLQNILYQLQIYCRGMSENDMRLELIEDLRKDQSNGIVLLVDDAQKLSCESIEELQLYLDFIREGQPHVRLVLAGSRGLEDRLTDNRLVAFNQRIAGRGFLSCLGRDETEAYVRAHLVRAGGNPDELFSPEAYRAIREVTDGTPRFINQVCDHAMIFSATRGVVPITDSLIREAWFDIQRLPGSVAPAGSGAAASETPVASQAIETSESEGWTVLEFGELNDSPSQGLDVAGAVPEAEAPADEAPADEAPVAVAEATSTVDSAVAPEAEADPMPSAPEPIQGPSFSVGQDGQVQWASPAEATPGQQAQEEEPAEMNSLGMAIPTAVGGAAILASAMQGFGVSEDEPLVEAQAAPVVSETQLETAPPATPEPSSQQPTESVTTKGQAQVVAEDPFGSFDNEEVLTDAYSPFVAQQNQRSLDLTSEQLQDLTPTDLEGSQSPISEADATPDVETEESFPTFETAMQPPEPVREPAQPTHEQRDSLETREATGPLGPSSLSEEFLVNRDAPGGQEQKGPETVVVAVDPVDAILGSGYVPLDPDASPVVASPQQVEQEAIPSAQSSDSISVSVNPAVSASPTQVISTETAPQEGFETQSQQIVAPNDSVPQVPDLSAPVEAKDSAATVYHEQSPTPNDTEIRRQAEEIIASLDVPGETGQEPFPVSHETLPSEPTVKEEMNAIEATIQRSIAAGQAAANEPANPTAEATPPVVMPDINAIQQALQQAQDRNGYQQIASTQPTEPVAPQSPEQLSPQNWPVPSQSEPQQTQPQQTQPQQTQSTGPQQEARPQQVAPEQVAVPPSPPMPPIPGSPTSIPVQIAQDPVQAERQILQEVQEQSAMITETTSEAQQAQDDRDILAINPSQQAPQPAAVSPAEELPSWTQQEPSTGEAARVDYQQLFDQLRNVPGQEQ